MSSDILQRFMKDLIKSAKETEGFIKGSRMTVEIGTVDKTAMDASTMLSGIPGLGPALGGLNASARSGNMGHGVATGIGASLGQAAGGAADSALGGLTDSDKMQLIMSILGSAGGGMLGGAAGRGLGEAVSHESGHDHIKGASLQGVKTAAARFGVKEAFLGPLLSMAGPMLARAGVGAAAKGAMGSGLAGMAGKIAPRIAGGMGGMAFDAAASMGGGALGQKLTPQHQPPQGMMG